MSRTLDIKVEKDHLISLTKASGESALAELIWNSLDADAKAIAVKVHETAVGVEAIEVTDDGNGINYKDADHVFGTIGGSVKKGQPYSPGNRLYHGKEGKGRFKGMALGDLVTYESTYKEGDVLNSFSVSWNKNDLKHPIIGEVSKDLRKKSTGVSVQIENVDQRKASFLAKDEAATLLETEFAVYYQAYPEFEIRLNGRKLDFTHLIKNISSFEFNTSDSSRKDIHFTIKLIEWTIEAEKHLHFCSRGGVTFLKDSIGIRTSSYPISLYLLSDHVEKLHRDNLLTLGEMDVAVNEAIAFAKEKAREYIRNRLHENARDFIEDLKKEEIYPYKSEPTNQIEDAERKVFDIVALQINEYSKFGEQDRSSRQLTLALVQQALESGPSRLNKILTEVINLPQKKQEELSDILETTSLTNIIDTFKEITDRLRIIHELQEILFKKELSKVVLERKHLHKIVANESWLFGDDYTYGTDDTKLRTVLKEYLKHLGREAFEEVTPHADVNNLEDIPDICLWKQYPRGKAGYFENLIIELKRPSRTIGTTEINQIEGYARAISGDPRFPKEKTSWRCVLLATKLNPDAEFKCNQRGRKFGHIYEGEGVDVFVLKWGDLLSEAEERHQYLKKKLDFNIEEGDEGIKLIKEKYRQYLPEVLTQASQTSP